MRTLILILLAATLSVNVACSKKKSSSSVATAPTPTNPTNPTYPGGVIPNYPAPQNARFYYGTVTVPNAQRQTYSNFLASAFGYQYYGQDNSYGYGYNQGYSYNYSYSCDINLFRWLFDDNLIDCGGGQSQYQDYVTWLAKRPAIVQFLFNGDGSVKGLWLADGFQHLDGNFYTYRDGAQIPFYGRLFQIQDGRFMIEAGPLVFLTTSTSNVMNFDVFFQESKLGNVTIR